MITKTCQYNLTEHLVPKSKSSLCGLPAVVRGERNGKKLYACKKHKRLLTNTIELRG